MNFRSIAAAVLLLASVANAQDRNCEDAKASTVERFRGVVVQKLVLTGQWGKNKATVFLPDTKTVEGAVVFSHSAIHYNNQSIDLLPMAITLASAGAAVIVPERSLTWPPNDAGTNREGPVVFCAARWIVRNIKVPNSGIPITNEEHIVVRNFFGYIGPRLCGSTVAPGCNLTNPFNWATEYHSDVWVPVGGTEGADSTKAITVDRGLQSAQWIQRQLGLQPIDVIQTADKPELGS